MKQKTKTKLLATVLTIAFIYVVGTLCLSPFVKVLGVEDDYIWYVTIFLVTGISNFILASILFYESILEPLLYSIQLEQDDEDTEDIETEYSQSQEKT